MRYVFRDDLRRAVIFARNDLVKDAPISRVDSPVRRNMLMYLNAETARNVLAACTLLWPPKERLIAFPARCVRTNNNTSIGAAQRG